MCTMCIWFGRQFILYLLTGFGVECLKHYRFLGFFFFFFNFYNFGRDKRVCYPLVTWALTQAQIQHGSGGGEN